MHGARGSMSTQPAVRTPRGPFYSPINQALREAGARARIRPFWQAPARGNQPASPRRLPFSTASSLAVGAPAGPHGYPDAPGKGDDFYSPMPDSRGVGMGSPVRAFAASILSRPSRRV